MKKSLVSKAVSAVSLLLAAVPLFAGELPFNAPATDIAQQRAELLRRAAHALDDLQSNAGLGAGGKHIADLWLFPTADASTVFARYTLGEKDGRDASAERLSVLTLHDNRIVDFRELTGARSELEAEYRKESAGAHLAAAGK
jgi:hypothetical protein